MGCPWWCDSVLAMVVGQTGLGCALNEQRRADGESEVRSRAISRGALGEATFENWESEFLQMGMYVA